MFKKWFGRKESPFMGGDMPKPEKVHELTPQLQQQLFELGRVTYLYLANAQTLADNVKSLAKQIDRDEKKAAKKGKQKSSPNPANLTPIPPPPATEEE